jgi:hypothetical protein
MDNPSEQINCIVRSFFELELPALRVHARVGDLFNKFDCFLFVGLFYLIQSMSWTIVLCLWQIIQALESTFLFFANILISTMKYYFAQTSFKTFLRAF